METAKKVAEGTVKVAGVIATVGGVLIEALGKKKG